MAGLGFILLNRRSCGRRGTWRNAPPSRSSRWRGRTRPSSSEARAAAPRRPVRRSATACPGRTTSSTPYATGSAWSAASRCRLATTPAQRALPEPAHVHHQRLGAVTFRLPKGSDAEAAAAERRTRHPAASGASVPPTRTRRHAGSGDPPKPWIYVIVATGNIFDDVDQARAAAQAGADVSP